MDQQEIEQLQFAQRQLSSLHEQNQQLHRQLLEIDSALEELSLVEEAYEMVGTVMIKKPRDVLEKKLSEKKAFIIQRKELFEKQEAQLKSGVEELQKNILETLDKEE
jgi:prefoldin beta subunit